MGGPRVVPNPLATRDRIVYASFFIIGPDGNLRGNNPQFARAAQAVLRFTF